MPNEKIKYGRKPKKYKLQEMNQKIALEKARNIIREIKIVNKFLGQFIYI
jgi:tRNA A-37 threonylcarbamoyl transferase component Bud32